MTPKRKAALQWFHDQGEILCSQAHDSKDGPSTRLIRLMLDDMQLLAFQKGRGRNRVYWFTLTDMGRRELHEAQS